ncbi:MAG: N5-glutamine methyltransferase family protein, partial [Longimicrobiales bacterium]
RNRDAAELVDKVDLRWGSLFEPLSEGENFDVIVSNPPYVAEVDEATLEPEVRDWEPREALFAGPDGLDVIRRMVGEARDHLKAGGLLALEVGSGHAPDVASLVEATGQYEEIRVLRDYVGRERFVLAHGA